MKYLLTILFFSVSLYSCKVDEEQTLEPVIYQDIDMGIDRECFVENEGENCFVLNIDSMYVDTIRFNLLKVYLKGKYNPSIDKSSIDNISSNFYSYKNGSQVDNLSLAAYGLSLSEDRWALTFNYGYFGGYDSLKARVALTCSFTRMENGQEVRTILKSKYTDLTTLKP